MSRIEFRKIVWGAILALALSATGAAVSPAYAQGAGDQGATRTDDRDDDTDLGWLGLLGLAGLLGLRRRDRVDHVDTTRGR